MKLWIRSQKKDVLLPVELEIQATGSEKIGYVMYGLQKYNASAITLGEYKSKERALEVLDEIHSCLQTNAGFDIYSKLGKFEDDYNKKYNLVPVYQMPIE